MDRRDDTLEEDVRKELQLYLQVNDDRSEKLAEKLAARIIQMEKQLATKQGLPYEDVSIAIARCPQSAAFAKHLQKLRDLLVEARLQETLKVCPTLSIQFQDLTWDEYYGGKSNIKYPDVRGLKSNLCKDGLVQKMMLFDLLQGQRHKCCKYGAVNLTQLVDKHANYPAIIIPSSGKGGPWLGSALSDEKNFWWVRCLSFAHVIFVVSDEELAAYKPFADKGISVVGYDGFGMGCGRAAGISIANQLGRICIMTDDRTKGLSVTNGPELTKEQLAAMIGPSEDNPLYCGGKPFITGVYPKGELNILTIINPNAGPVKPTFSKYFISSKEDKGLYLYCQALQKLDPSELGETNYDLQVHFDASNPPYQNTASKFTGKKGEAIQCITASDRYLSPANKPIDWKHLSGAKKFKNQWDALKMQDSAMYLLLKEIVEELKPPDDSEESLADWNAFNKYISPWFS